MKWQQTASHRLTFIISHTFSRPRELQCMNKAATIHRPCAAPLSTHVTLAVRTNMPWFDVTWLPHVGCTSCYLLPMQIAMAVRWVTVYRTKQHAIASRQDYNHTMSQHAAQFPNHCTALGIPLKCTHYPYATRQAYLWYRISLFHIHKRFHGAASLPTTCKFHTDTAQPTQHCRKFANKWCTTTIQCFCKGH